MVFSYENKDLPDFQICISVPASVMKELIKGKIVH